MNINEIFDTLKSFSNWIPIKINIVINTEQFIAILKGYPPNWETQSFGLVYNYYDGYFYTYRSEYIVGKYKFEKTTENKYTCTESFENPQLSDSRVIIECIREACCYNNVQYQTL